MQSYSINSQKRKLQVIMVAFIIITMFPPLIVHADVSRTINFSVSYNWGYEEKNDFVLANSGQSVSTTFTGSGNVFARCYQSDYELNNCRYVDKFTVLVASNNPFTYLKSDNSVANGIKYNDLYYAILLSKVGGLYDSFSCAVPKVSVDKSWGTTADIYNVLDSIDLSKDDYKEISFDTDTRHDFGSDIVDTSIPTPELTNITHNGFIVSNMGDYYIDVYTESFLYGVSMKKITSRWLPEVDTSWVYSSHKYNFVDLSDVAVSSSNVNIKTLWNVDNELNLVNDFKKWSSEFPDINSLPSYSFTKGSSAGSTQYNLNHNYNKVIGDSDSEKLRTSAQACTVFYVRFYTKDIKCGQWMKYTYRDGAKNAGASVTVEQVSFSKTGEETTIDKAEGRQDYDTGITDFDSSNDLSFDLTDVDSFFNYLTSIFDSCKNSVSAFASLIYACVPFLPSELINVIVLAIVIMLFIGIIKAVVS